MNRDEADRLLAVIGAAHDRIATAMYGIDSHPALEFLRTGPFIGRTAQLQLAVLPEIDVMWAQFGAIGDILEAARGIRAAHRPSDPQWNELVRLLSGPAVTLDSTGAPTASGAGSAPLAPPPAYPTGVYPTGNYVRPPSYPPYPGAPPYPGTAGYPGPAGYPTPAAYPGGYPMSSGAASAPLSGLPSTGDPFGAARAVGTVRVGDVARSLEGRCATMGRLLDDLNRAWTAAGSAVAPSADAMGMLADLALNAGDQTDVAILERRTRLLRDDLLGDPLGAAPAGTPTAETRAAVAALDADIATAAARLRAMIGLRDSYGQRITDLHAEIDTLAAEETETVAAFERATEKIADTGLPPNPTAAVTLRQRVIELDGPRGRGEWRKLADDVATLRASLTRAVERARELRGAADGLLARRDELRGRLDAYRAKAVVHRLDEDEDLSRLHVAARDLLYTAPCNLPAATKAVVAYQTALTALVGKGGAQPHVRKEAGR